MAFLYTRFVQLLFECPILWAFEVGSFLLSCGRERSRQRSTTSWLMQAVWSAVWDGLPMLVIYIGTILDQCLFMERTRIHRIVLFWIMWMNVRQVFTWPRHLSFEKVRLKNSRRYYTIPFILLSACKWVLSIAHDALSSNVIKQRLNTS